LSRPAAPALLRALRRRLPGFHFDTEAFETALHEAILNAAIHGNLGLTAAGNRSSSAIDTLASAIDDRLRHAALAQRKVTITAAGRGNWLLVTVGDEGSGFAAELTAAPDKDLPHGRGIMLMRKLAAKVTYSDGGRTVCLTFPLHPADRRGDRT
jgi:anti-sigma regulatory factor (Ser/Thr protein kinase)